MDKEKEIKDILKSLIISSPRGITVEQLLRDFREMEGRNIPHQALGYSNVFDFLNNIPDTLRIHGNGIKALVIPVVSKKVAHIEEMIQRQRRPEVRSTRRRRPFRAIMRPNAIRASSPVEDDRSHFSGSFNSARSINSPIEPAVPKSFESNYSQSPPPASYTESNSNPKANSVQFANPLPPSLADCPTARGAGDEPSETSDTESQYVYKQRQRVRANLSKESIRSHNEALSQPVSTLPVQSYTDPLKKKLRELIDCYPSGIWCSELPKLYREHFNEDLNVQAKGYCSVIHFCSSHYDVFRCLQQNKGDWKVYDARCPPPSCENNNEPAVEVGSETRQKELKKSPRKKCTSGALPDDLQLDLEFSEEKPIHQPPEDVLQYGENLNRQWLEVPEDGYVTVQVTQIYDPSKFWIQLYSEDCSVALEKLMNKIQNFYALVGDVYNIPESTIKVGLYCVALFESEWHRGIVAKIEDRFVKVFYFDFGTVGKVSINSLKYLHKDFCALPRQAIRARLANIRPRSPAVMWSRRASVLMLELVANKVLVAEVMNKRNYRNYVLNVILTDTSDETTDVHINDELKKRGFAQIISEDLSEIDLYNQKGQIEKFYYFLYPSHKDIEDAVVPTVDEIDIMVKNGIAIEMIFKPYIISLELNKPFTSDLFDLTNKSLDKSISIEASKEEILFADDEDEDESTSSISSEENMSLNKDVEDEKLKDETAEKSIKSESEESHVDEKPENVNEPIVEEPESESTSSDQRELALEVKTTPEIISTSNSVSLPLSTVKPPPGYMYSQTITTNNFVSSFPDLNSMPPPPTYNPFNNPNKFLLPPHTGYYDPYLSGYNPQPAPPMPPHIPPNYYPYMYGSMPPPQPPPPHHLQNPTFYGNYNMGPSTSTFYNTNPSPPFIPNPMTSRTNYQPQQHRQTPPPAPQPPKSSSDSNNELNIDLKKLAELLKVDENLTEEILLKLGSVLKKKLPKTSPEKDDKSFESDSLKNSSDTSKNTDSDKTEPKTTPKKGKKNSAKTKKSKKKKEMQKQNSTSSSAETPSDSINDASDNKQSKKKSKSKHKTKVVQDNKSNSETDKSKKSPSKNKSNTELKNKNLVTEITGKVTEDKKKVVDKMEEKFDKLKKDQEKESNPKIESKEQTSGATATKSSVGNCIIQKEFLGRRLIIIKINKQLYLSTLQFMLQFTRFDDIDRVRKLFDSESIEFPSIEFSLEKYPKIYKTLLQNKVPGCLPDNKVMHLLKIEDAFIMLDILFASNTRLIRELQEFAQEESLRSL